jgi:sulfane dehydrogenase subunit SoxC
MVQAEARHVARRSAQDIDCDCKDGMFPRASFADRRTFLFAAKSLAVAAPALAQTAKTPPGAIQFPVPDDPTKEQGRLVAADQPLQALSGHPQLHRTCPLFGG